MEREKDKRKERKKKKKKETKIPLVMHCRIMSLYNYL